TAAGYSFGDRALTALDWNNAPDPRPDYYRYLPSYYGMDPYQQQQLENLWRNDENTRQINWQNIYNANRFSYESVQNAFGIPNFSWTGRRARYIIEERVTNTKRLNLNSVLNSKLNDMVDVAFGASYQTQNNNYYKKVDDLLGAEFYVDVNQFAQRDFPDNNTAAQNDLENPNRILFEGDRFGYDYNMHINRMAAWGQGVFKFSKVDFFLAAELSNTEFWRVGNVRNGLFPNNSYGKSDVNDFLNYQLKGGITYKVNGRNYLYVNGATLTRAPFFENAYISPRTRDVAQDDMVSEKVNNVEGGYIHNSPRMKVRLSGYYTTFEDQLNVLSFYHDEYQNFVNYALSNIDKIHYGGEFGFEGKITPTWTVNAAAAVGRYFFNSRQNAIITLDNDASVLNSETIYSQNFRIASTPQEAYSLGFTYRSPNFWFASITGNYFDQMWLDFNPIRRTYAATQDVPYKSDKWNAIIDQTQWEAQYTVDFFAGYSWRLPRKYNINKKPVYLVFNAGVNNLTNNKDIITGGYEQLRFDFENRDVNKFPPKVYYAYGLNYFLGATIRF
ncbi:MAG TPA: TonB-dependent receptor, partial [Flavisolibacter sp.]